MDTESRVASDRIDFNTYMKMQLEQEIDSLLKTREILFRHRDEEAFNSSPYRSLNGRIQYNTKRIKELRERWKRLNTGY